MRERSFAPFLRGAAQRLLAGVGALVMTLALFMVLPLIQSISAAPKADLVLQSVDTTELPPPPPPPPEEEEPEETEQEEEPPELEPEATPLDLDQLELALDPGAIGAGMGQIKIELDSLTGGKDGSDGGIFSLADLDQRPRAIYQPSPILTPKVRKKAPGTVYVLFVVDEQGRVDNPIVQSSDDPIFERPALSAIKQWKFEPGKRNGQPVRFRMRIPITFTSQE